MRSGTCGLWLPSAGSAPGLCYIALLRRLKDAATIRLYHIDAYCRRFGATIVALSTRGRRGCG